MTKTIKIFFNESTQLYKFFWLRVKTWKWKIHYFKSVVNRVMNFWLKNIFQKFIHSWFNKKSRVSFWALIFIGQQIKLTACETVVWK